MGRVKILKASAGSGKTYRLAYDYIRGVVLEPHRYGQTLAVTFTNKATEQMKRRIIGGLNALAQDDPARGDSPYLEELMSDTGLSREQIAANAKRARSLILHDYSRFAVSTIDKFFQRVVRAFFKELGLDFDYTVEIDREWVLAAAVDRLLEQTATDAALREAVAALVQGRIEQEKSWNVEPEITGIGGELFREDYVENPLPPEQVHTLYKEIAEGLRVRFEAVKDLAARAVEMIDGAGLSATDFKQSKNSFAAYLYKLAGSQGPIPYNSYFRKSLEGAQEWYTKSTPYLELILGLEEELMPLLRRIAEGIDELLPDWNTEALVREKLGRSLLLGRLGQHIRTVAGERNLMMIHQTGELIHRLVSGNDAPFIYEKLGNAYGRYMIDEFQDTSRKQWENFLPLLENALAGEPSDDAVLLIGDVKQSIYRWRGGNWRILGFEAERRFGRELAEPVEMKTNWRSERSVIEFNNGLIRRVAQRDEQALGEFLANAPEDLKGLAGVLEHSYAGFEQAASPARQAGEPHGYVEVAPLLRDQIGGRVVATVADLRGRGYAYRDMAVLVRDNKEARQLADLLLEAGYPIVSQEALLLSGSPAVEFVMAVFRLATQPQDGIARGQYNAFLGRGFGQELPKEERMFVEGLLRVALVEAFEMILERYGLGRREEAVSFLQALYQVILSYSKQNLPDIPLLLEWWAQHGAKRTVYLPSEQDAITIMTIHKAKGLEFGCVILPHCDWSLLPKSGATLWVEADEASEFKRLGRVPIAYKKQMEESRFAAEYYIESVQAHVDNLNLLYVALTRAERELYVLYDRHARGEDRVSKLIEAVLPDFTELQEVQGGGYSYGAKEPAPGSGERAQGERELVFPDLPTHSAMQQVRVRWASDRYFGDESGAVSPRRHGVAMHRLFETIDRGGGEIPPEFRAAFADPLVADWFAPGRWEVNSEREIITPTGMRRPDRVMTREGEAVVVDYKFGSVRRPGYHAQVKEYMELLRQMGYRTVRGYVWYVELSGGVEQVS